MKLAFQHLKTLALACIITTLINPSLAQGGELLVKQGEKIAFLGDSITAGGFRKGGFAKLVMDTLNKEGLDLKAIPAGKSGNRSPDMFARLENDVIKKEPDWMILSCGVNDVWHFTLRLGDRTFTGVPLEDYRSNITSIIEQTQAANIKVLVLTSTMIGEDPEKDTNQKLIPYNEFLREIAAEKNLPIADLNKQMQAALKKIPDQPGKASMFGDPSYQRDIRNKLTSDGCHMNAEGNVMMAKGVLRALGVNEEKISAAEDNWRGK